MPSFRHPLGQNLSRFVTQYGVTRQQSIEFCLKLKWYCILFFSHWLRRHFAVNSHMLIPNPPCNIYYHALFGMWFLQRLGDVKKLTVFKIITLFPNDVCKSQPLVKMHKLWACNLCYCSQCFSGINESGAIKGVTCLVQSKKPALLASVCF